MDLNIINEDFTSEFETDSESEKKRKKRFDLAVKQKQAGVVKVSTSDLVEKSSKEEGIKQRHHILSLDAYARHKKLINDYFLTHKGAWANVGRDTSRDRNDADIIRENHKFIWDDDDDHNELTWDMRLAKKYYDKLFKEYCIADLSRYKENKVALRWRIEKEVVSGKGQFICGDKRCEVSGDNLRSWEVNFSYLEGGQKRNALVKLRLCPACSLKLNYHHQRREAKRRKRRGHSHAHDEGNEKRPKTEGEAGGSSASVEEGGSDKAGDNTSSGGVEGDRDKQKQVAKQATEIWSQLLQLTEEKSREEEFEDYLADMLL